MNINMDDKQREGELQIPAISMPENSKIHTLIDINSPLSMDYRPKEEEKEEKIPFFRPLSQRKENTWVVSLFVIFHLVAFAITMFVNDCWQNSSGDCALKPLGRLSFQHLSENPLLGPSASALDEMGALRERYFSKNHEVWRIFTSPWLHSGIFHLIINLSSIIFVGIHLEQDFGPFRIGVIYIFSAFTGGMVAALFLQDRPSVASSGALFGLLGAMLSGLIRDWKLYSKKFATLVAFSVVVSINLILGLLPSINNFSNIGGIFAGFLLGFVLLYSPEKGKMAQKKAEFFDNDAKRTLNLTKKLDRPFLRSISVVLFGLLLSGLVVAVLRGVNLNKYCSWCQYVDCMPSKWWSCSNKAVHCETLASTEQLTITCPGTDKFKVFPFTNISQPRIEDLCYLVCS